MNQEANFMKYGPATWLRSAILVVVTAILLSLAAFAQTTGTITGTVLDSTGAVIPEATIVLLNQATHDRRETVSNGLGYFTFASLMPADYTVRISAKGFKTFEVTGIHVLPGDVRNLSNINLGIGTTKEIVQVEASAAGAEVVASAEHSATITANDIERQSTQGRNALELIRLLPGMAIRTQSSKMDNKPGYDPTQQNIYSSPVSGYGMNGVAPQTGGVAISSDGAQIIDPGDMGATIATVNMDMVQEVKVQTANFDASTNKGPVVVNAVGKSGGSAYHGSAYFYARNSVLNSTDWFVGANPELSKPEDRYYYPGGTFGGPVKIPHTNLGNKMFFFVGFEYYSQLRPNDYPISTTVPTDGERIGDFSWDSMKSLCGPQMPEGWQPFQQNPNVANVNQGPQYCITPTVWWDVSDPNASAVGIVNGQLQQYITPAGQAYMNLFPTANVTPTKYNNFSNYVDVFSNSYPSWQLHPRVDYNFNDNNKLYVTYNLQKEVDPQKQGIYWWPQNSMVFPGNVEQRVRSHGASINYLRVFSPTLTNEAMLSFAHFNGPFVMTNPGAVSRGTLNFPTVFNNGIDQIPSMYNWWPGGTPQVYMPGGFLDNQGISRKVSYNLQDNMTKVIGTHILKFGVYYERTSNAQALFANTNGFMRFNPNPWQWVWAGPSGNYSGWQGCSEGSATPSCFNNVANILLGWPDWFTQDQKPLSVNMYYKNLAFYVTDSWKATNRLTLDLGLRLDRLTPWNDAHGLGLAVFDPALYAKQVTVDEDNFSTTSTVQYPGMKWHATDPSVPMAGSPTRWAFVSPRVGLAWDVYGTGKTVIRGGWGMYRWHDSYNAYSGALNPGLDQHTFTQDAPYGGWTFDTIRTLAGSTQGQLFGDGKGYFVDARDDQMPLTTNWNLTLTHQSPWNSLFELSYVGNESTHLMAGGKNQSINLIPVGGYYRKLFPTAALDTQGRAAISGLSGSTQDWYRPYTWYNDTLNGTMHKAWSNYHSLQASWNRSKGWATYGLNYTWSKTMGIFSDSDPFHLATEYGPLNFDRTHVFNASYSFDLGNRVHGSRLLGGMANGWQISGITQWQSGTPLQATSNSHLGFGGSGYQIANTYNYDASGDPKIPNQVFSDMHMDSANVLGTPDVGLQPYVKAGCDPTAKNGNSNSYLNTNCWQVPQFLQNGPVYYGYFHSPAYFTSDLSLFKTFKTTEKTKLQFRVSAFNFLNHPLWSFTDSDWKAMNLGLSGGVYQPGQQLKPSDFYYNTLGTPPDATYVGTPHVKFGRRVIQLAAKFEF
jgi:hypothetical protein